MTWRWDESSPGESVNADAIKAAVSERKPLCSQCFKIYTPHERSFAEWFQARSILLIPDSEPHPMVCDDCFDRVVQTYNRHITNIGTSNCGPTNTLLAHN